MFLNLNFLRLLLALMVTWSHAYPLTARAEPISGLIAGETGGSIAVKCFFFISGVLITNSVRKLPWRMFIVARLLRIWPALFCSLVVGTALASVVSAAPISEFIIGSLSYFFNNLVLFAGVQYTLPGAFLSNPNTSVNGSLWTLPWEVRMYAFVLIGSMLGLLSRREIANLLILVVVLVCLSGENYFFGFPYDNPEARLMVLCFIVGVFVSSNFEVRQYKVVSFAMVLCGAAIWFVGAAQLGVMTVLCGLTLAVGFLRIIPLPSITLDMSYGIYVYSFPLQQFAYAYFDLHTPAQMLSFVVPAAFLLAYMSWRWVESPAIELNKKIRRRTGVLSRQDA